MDNFQNKDITQAVLIADNNVENFFPISKTRSTALISLVNVPLLDYALESLNQSGIEEVFIVASVFINDIREHIKKRVEECCTWSINMKVQVIGTEGCRCLGDAIRDLDTKGFIRNDFILLGANTITNANLKPILDQHKKTAKFDKGTALTIIFKEGNSKQRTGDEVMIAIDIENKRLHYHQRLKVNSKEKDFRIPLEVFGNSQVALYHNLLDPQIAICSPSVLALFSDNFDFETRDDFIRGLLINEEILDSRIYVALLGQNQYARKVSNWLTYQIISNDLINRWVYPLVPDMGICSLFQNYSFLRNNIYKNQNANISKVLLKENVVIQANTSIDSGSVLSSSVIGINCKIGRNCVLHYAFLEDNVTVEDDCILNFCLIGKGSIIQNESKLLDGIIVGENVRIPKQSNLKDCFIQNSAIDDTTSRCIGDKAFIIDNYEEINQSDSEEEELEPIKTSSMLNMQKMTLIYEDSDYNSSSEEEDESREPSPVLDDTNIFLSEVIDSLARGFQEKSNPDFLILEINSSRYAYNMTLKEVNFNVVKAVFNLEPIKEADATNVLTVLNQVFNHLGSVISNYIKTEESMMDALKAVEECLNTQPILQPKAAKIIHYLYDKEYISEEAILGWFEQLDDESEWLKNPLQILVNWLNQSEEETSEEEST